MSKDTELMFKALFVAFLIAVTSFQAGNDHFFNSLYDDCQENGEVDRLIEGRHIGVKCETFDVTYKKTWQKSDKDQEVE